MNGTGIKTNGIGQKTTAHLNLTVSMKDWFGKIIAPHPHPQVRAPKSREDA